MTQVANITQDAQSPECYICKRNFRTNKGLLQHLNTCRRKNSTVSNVHVNIDNQSAVVQEDLTQQDRESEKFYWNTAPGNVYQKDLEEAYEQIVYWRKNVFMVPTGASGKKFVNEITRLFDQWTNDTPLKSIALKAIHVMPALLLQKLSRKSKARYHLIALEKRLKLWGEGNINELLDESKEIQERLSSTNTPMNLQKISMKFKHLMQKGNVSGALKLLTNNMSNGILPLTDETLHLLRTKHPEIQNAHEEVLLQGAIKQVHPVVYEAMDEALISKAELKTKGGCGPSAFYAENWRRILVSKSCGSSSLDLRKSFPNFTRTLCTRNLNTSVNDMGDTLEAFIANRLIPLNKNPGIRPIGVGEVIRPIAGKVIMDIAKKDVQQAAGSLQVCAGQDAGAEAAIHAMYDLFQQDETEAVLLVDTENAFNSINRKSMLHNISITCPILSTFVSNCYLVPARLFILGNKEIKSKEGTTQGDPTTMAAYALGVSPLIHFLQEYVSINNHRCKEVAFADDFTIAGKIEGIRSYWELLQQVGPLYGYFSKPSKSYLVVKE